MILRRVIDHVRRQEWTAIWIDLVIVVVGVFIGIQVANWNEARAEARLGRYYVDRLIHDLTEDQGSIRMQANYYSSVLKSTLYTDELLRAADPDPQELVVNAYRATEVAYTAPVRATWDQIVSSGHLGLLPVEAAESRLTRYHAFDTAHDIYQRGVDSSYRQTVRKIIPLAIQVAIREGCSDVRDDSGDIIAFEKECKLDVDPAALEAVAATLRSDPAVAAELRHQYSFAASTVLNLGSVGVSISDALHELGAGDKAVGETSP